MDTDIQISLLQLITDVQRRRAKIGDLSYDTLVAAYGELLNSSPNLCYIKVILSLALSRAGKSTASAAGALTC